jgi:hypothetical protein
MNEQGKQTEPLKATISCEKVGIDPGSLEAAKIVAKVVDFILAQGCSISAADTNATYGYIADPSPTEIYDRIRRGGGGETEEEGET